MPAQLDDTTIEHISTSLQLRLQDLHTVLARATDEDTADAARQSIDQIEITLAKWHAWLES